MLLIFSLSILTIPILFIISFKLAKTINLYDNPDKVRKLHLKPVLLVGGIFFQLLFIFYLCFFLYLNSIKYSKITFQITNTHFILLLVIFITFLIGIIDDKKNIKPWTKLILIFLVYFFTISRI